MLKEVGEALAKGRRRKRMSRPLTTCCIKLESALSGKGGKALALAIGHKYRAALIDEFQDTDPVQYAIFRSIFGQNPGSILFLVGDPKQSIYGFRGAEIFAYMEAADKVRFPLHPCRELAIGTAAHSRGEHAFQPP
jgi:exodeoxyribonuclease V beta subunit